MPLGKRYVEIGRLEADEGAWLLRRDGGGTWRLDLGFMAGLRARRLRDHRVRVDGIRIEYDVIAVTTISEEEAKS